MEVDEEIKGRAEGTRSSAVGMRLRGNKSKRQEQEEQEREITGNSTLANGGDIRHYEVRRRSSF
jgi:hypothetical protein